MRRTCQAPLAPAPNHAARAPHLLWLEPRKDGRLSAVIETDDEDPVLAGGGAATCEEVGQFLEEAHLPLAPR